MFKIQLLISLVILLSNCGSSDNETNSNETSLKDTFTTDSEPKRYFVEIFNEVNISTHTYGKNTTQGGKEISLQLDVYQPTGDTLAQRPLIIFIHGGGFRMNNRTTIQNLGFLQKLTKSGFVVASIDYRLIDTPENSSTLPIAILNAVEDTRAAIRFFKKDYATSNLFKIDPNRIILGGYSAGAVTTLHTVFLNSLEKINTYLPTFANYVTQNGGIAGQTGNLGCDSDVFGIFNVAGGVVNENIIDGSVNFMYHLHGTDDVIVPFEKNNQLIGSKIIHEKALQLGVNSKLNAPKLGHDIMYSCEECRADLQQFMATQVTK